MFDLELSISAQISALQHMQNKMELIRLRRFLPAARTTRTPVVWGGLAVAEV